MQLIKSWEDKRYGVQNSLYEIDGIKVVHTLNSNSLDTVLSVIVKAGSFFEKALDVPMGTAHFLEHMIAGNPNKQHKTKKQLDLYDLGGKKRPRLMINAYTSEKIIAIWGKSNSKGENRLSKRILNIIDYPLNRFTEFIEKERRVISSERNSSPKTEKYEAYQFQKFLLDYQQPGKATLILGELEDIASVKVADLRKFYNSTFTPSNTIIAVQSPRKIKGQFKENLQKIVKVLKKNRSITPQLPKEQFENVYRYQHFNDDREQGTTVSIVYGQDLKPSTNYRENILRKMQINLVNYVAFKRIREKFGLVYYFTNYDWAILEKYYFWWFQFSCDYKNLTSALNQTYELIFKYAEKFLKTKEGTKWFEDGLSSHIFPNTIAYNSSYAEEIADRLIQGRDVYDIENAIKLAETLTREDLLKFLRENVQNIPPHIWISSSLQEKEVISGLKRSKLHKHWSSSIRKKLQK